MSEIETKIKSTLENKYEIKSLIAKGGMGEVYLGIHRALDKRVAIKIIHQELSKNEEIKKRFYREAKLAAGLDHPGIIDIYDFGGKDDFNYIIMPYIEGSTLKEKLDKEGKLGLRECLRLMIAIADALSYAHSKNVIHRDIKPANIMIDNKGNIILTDFGISKDLGDVDLTLPDSVLGSPKYMSPEQIKGLKVDTRSDLYALGLIFYEMITGKHPFEGKDTTSLYYSHVHETPRRLEDFAPDVPNRIGDIILKLLEKSPEKRYQSGDQLVKDLEGCSSSFSDGSRLDVDATMADIKALPDEEQTRIASGESEAHLIEGASQALLQGRGPESMVREKKSSLQERKGLKWVVPLSALALIGVIAIVWIMRPSSATKTVPEQKTATTETSLGHKEKVIPVSEGQANVQEPLPAVTSGKSEPEIVATLRPRPDEALPPRPVESLRAKPSFDSIVKEVLALGQEREAAFLKLWVNKPEFRIGDSISYKFQSQQDCYVVVFVITPGGELIQLFPNRFSLTQFIEAKKNYSIPGGEIDIALEVTGPPGNEVLVALASEAPFNPLFASYESQPFFVLDKDNQALLEKIGENVQAMERLNLAQRRLSYAIIE
jgi:serine/threonine protein kinase